MGLFTKKIKTDQEIKQEVIKKLKKQGISYNEEMLNKLKINNAKVKTAEQVKKRALANMLVIQLACSIRNNENYTNSLLFVIQQMEKWNLKIEDVLPKERVLLHNKFTQKDNPNEFTQQDIIDIVWTYECNWSLLWALDLITDKELIDASKLCNTERQMAISGIINGITSLRLRNIDKILEKVYLFYCYQWALDEKKNNSNLKTRNLNYEVVVERRRGLQWLIDEEKDWNNITLVTFH